jgi:hypothetical protein
MKRLVVLAGLVLVLAGCGATEKAQVVESPNTVAQGTPTTTVAPTTTKAPPYTPVPTDFALGVVELRRACFGSAGCSVTFQIDPQYIGAVPPNPLQSYRVIYQVEGLDDPLTGNFEMTNLRATGLRDEIGQTVDGSVITAAVVRIVPA